MKQEEKFIKSVCNLAIPVALQSILQASFSIIDQVMIGQLGSVNVAGVGLGGKFASIFSVLVSAIGAVAGIMISQYMGQKNKYEVRRSLLMNLLIAAGLAGGFTILCLVFQTQIMGLYTPDESTRLVAASYLAIISGTFIPIAGMTLLSTLFRCMEKALLPLYVSIFSSILNILLNYILIFGKLGFSPMGVSGAAIATVISQVVSLLLMLRLFVKYKACIEVSQETSQIKSKFNWKQYGMMLLPILVCELMWSLGENVYAGIYGNLGTESTAAMTLLNPIQGLTIGALCGLAQAASILVGKRLGNEDYDEAYSASKKLIYYGFVGAVILALLIIATNSYYVQIYQVEESVKHLTKQIAIAYAVIAPFKVLNMILGGGIIRSGGKTKYVMIIDLIGTWVFGVPLGLFAAFVLKLPIPYVYFILSLEECIRFGISLVVFRRKKWMQSLKVG